MRRVIKHIWDFITGKEVKVAPVEVALLPSDVLLLEKDLRNVSIGDYIVLVLMNEPSIKSNGSLLLPPIEVWKVVGLNEKYGKYWLVIENHGAKSIVGGPLPISEQSTITIPTYNPLVTKPIQLVYWRRSISPLEEFAMGEVK